MTRESEKSKIRMSVIVDGKHINSLKKADEVINQIFDYFGEKLQDKDDEIELLKHRVEELIKPKTCEGCSNLFFDEIEKVYKCSNDVSDDVGYLHGEAVIRNIKDFHCVQHQPKDNA